MIKYFSSLTVAIVLMHLSGCQLKEDDAPPIQESFPKTVKVFDLEVIATAQTSDASILHAANILAQYLDNDENGEVDNKQVYNKLVEQKTTLVIAKDSEDLDRHIESVDASGRAYQDLLADEIQLIKNSEFDASIEEVLHLITTNGYALIYPDIFGEHEGSAIANAMDIARGGFFKNTPTTYPQGAWYTYVDSTCEYGPCHVAEYTYWALTSILGAHNNDLRAQYIADEWLLHSPELVMEIDPTIYQILTNATYQLPTILPNGFYQPKTFNIISSDPENTVQYQLSQRKQFSGKDGLSFTLEFMEKNSSEQAINWDSANIQPYINAAKRWLNIVSGIKAQSSHNINIQIIVGDLEQYSNTVDSDSHMELQRLVLKGQYYFTSEAIIVIDKSSYDTNISPETISQRFAHQLGHTLGFNQIIKDKIVHFENKNKDKFYKNDETNNDSAPFIAYKKYVNSEAQTILGIPFTDDLVHFYGFNGDAEPRVTHIPDINESFYHPPVTNDIMANGLLITEVTLGLLDELGYVIKQPKTN